MKKISIIFDETTLLNFRFIIKLMQRYRIMTLSVPVLVAIVSFFIYVSQEDLYTSSLTFKSSTSESDSSMGRIASMLGEKGAALTSAEVMGIAKSTDVINDLAGSIYNRQDVSKLNFSLPGIGVGTPDEIFPGCTGKKECVLQILTERLRSFYAVETDPMIEGQYWLKVKSLEEYTTLAFIDEIAKSIQRTRTKALKAFLIEQRRVSEELIQKKKDEMGNIDISALTGKKLALEDTLTGLDYKLRTFGQLYHTQKTTLGKAEADYDQTQQSLKKEVSRSEVELSKKYVALKDRLTELNQDVTAIEVNGATGKDDKIILQQLKNELGQKKRELAALGNVDRSLTGVDEFMRKKDQNAENTEFDYKVLKKQFGKMEKEYQVIVEERNRISDEKIVYDRQLIELKPSLEYLTLLESKIMQLKLLESTVVSDLVFEKSSTRISSYKQLSRNKIIVFSLAIAFFLVFIVTVIRYLFDDRIYNEYELKKLFSGLEVIGNTPDFDQE